MTTAMPPRLPANPPSHRRLQALVLATALAGAACSSSGSGPTANAAFSGATVAPPSLVYLDSVLLVGFAVELDPTTLTEQSVQLRAIAGPGVGSPVRGTWRVGSLGTAMVSNTIEFEPELPHGEPLLTSGGLQPDTTYELRIVGGDTAFALRSRAGRPLQESLRFEVRTRTGVAASELFGQNAPGGPQLIAVTATPQTPAGSWRLGRSNEPAELRLRFNQPLDPSEQNLPRAPSVSARGPIELVYDDPVYGPGTWIAADVELERNATLGTTVVLHPRGVLPSAANLRLVLGSGLRDLFGEARSTPGPQVAATVGTETAYAPQFDAVAIDLAQTMAPGAADFPEVPAVVENGALRVPDTFAAVAGTGDWAPTGPEVVLRTDLQTLRYTTGRDQTFTGGVLHMRNLHIGQGQIVRGVGQNPLVLIVDGDAQIDGLLTVSGANASTIPEGGQYRGPGDLSPPYMGNSSAEGGGEPAQSGPAGGPGGGRGGRLPFPTALEIRVAGQSPSSWPDQAGDAGWPGCLPCTRSSAGGGGAFATAGDPWFPTPSGASSSFVQRSGTGGYGCSGASGASTRTLVGGASGVPWFRNGDSGDDFWGDAFVPSRGQRRRGELPSPTGGAGGGAGGSYSFDGSCSPSNPWGLYRGGDGGGGGGIVVVQVRGTLTIGPLGSIQANGGSGGRASRYGDEVGGGGGGAGGMVVLMAGRGIVLHTHGETFANRDYDFALSADGGVCRTSTFLAPTVQSKYPANGQPTISGSTYDSSPLGGFGGLGVIQLMVPTGTDNQDGTNTVLDDSITIVRNGQTLQGAEKQRFLGWRGFPDDQGNFVDDFGTPTNTAGGQGDLRPAPVLLPAPFTIHGRARARSGWLPLGALQRRSVGAPDGEPRAVVGENLRFARPARSDGWLPFGAGRLAAETGGVALLEAPVAIASFVNDTMTFAEPVYAVRLAAPLQQVDRDQFVGSVAELRQSTGGTLLRLRVLGNTADTLFLVASAPLPPQATHLQLHGFYAELATTEPQSYLAAPQTWLPRANARLGFAFHRDPARAATNGYDPERYPPQVGTFVTDPSDPSVRTALQTLGPTHLQWDVLLDGEFRRDASDQPPPADAGSALALRRLWLPVRF